VAKLIINPQTPSRKEIDLPQGGLSIGRDPSNDVVIPDALVSRKHARILFDGHEYLFHDCESSNGSLLNGNRVSERRLADGDVLWLGASRLLFRAPDHVTEGSLAKVIQHPSSPKVRCPTCEQGCFASDVYCRNCGTTLESEAKGIRCGRCQARVTGPARFCNNCGEPMSSRADRSQSLQVPPEVRMWREAEATALAAAAAAPSPAPVDKRLLAAVVDALAAGSLFALFSTLPLAVWLRLDAPALALALMVLPFASVAAYFVGFWASRGSTPGKDLLGLSIVMQDPGRRFGLREACIRFGAFCVSLATLGLGFLMVLIDGDSLHDGLAGTRVIERQP
jgi:pSer/pThr/pTyr-binding forkhead associated (FHA) protein/uncharacterized RDD family membrane protein YckC